MTLNGLLSSRIAWTFWAAIPVVALAWHAGPGERDRMEAQATRIIADADTLQAHAESLQAAAYELHLESIDARRAALSSESPTYARIAADVAAREDSAYGAAAAAWKEVADRLHEAHAMLEQLKSPITGEVRVARSRALIRSGQLSDGVGDLESMLEELAAAGEGESPLAQQAREEMATGYYYGARLMRVTGRDEAEWREIAGRSRQSFRYLAETHDDDGERDRLQQNVEVVLSLEQSGEEDLFLKPRPGNCPGTGNCDGLGPSRKKGKSRTRGQRPDDARGAGDKQDIPSGW